MHSWGGKSSTLPDRESANIQQQLPEGCMQHRTQVLHCDALSILAGVMGYNSDCHGCRLFDKLAMHIVRKTAQGWLGKQCYRCSLSLQQTNKQNQLVVFLIGKTKEEITPKDGVCALGAGWYVKVSCTANGDRDHSPVL